MSVCDRERERERAFDGNDFRSQERFFLSDSVQL